MTNPILISTPFATSGDKNTIQESVPSAPNNPTWEAGFPVVTSTPINEGGLPPTRKDFNGVLNAVTDNIVHQSKGLMYEFDAAYATKIGGYPLNAQLMLTNGDIVQSTIANNANDPNLDMTGWKNKSKVTASDVSDSSGKNQQQINDAVLGISYLAELEGFSSGNTPEQNSAAWTDLQTKMQAGDSVLFEKGTFQFANEIIVNKQIKISGQYVGQSAGTTFEFPNNTNGIVRTVRGGEICGLRLLGRKTSTVIDPSTMTFGLIGLWDKYDDTAKAGYVNTRVIHLNGWDTGRVNATGGSEVWNGAYRETYDTFVQSNRWGCVFLNGSTHDKYYGGAVSANSEIGIWAEAPRVQYNNISFIGTTIESNGNVDSGAGYAGIDYRTNCSIFAGANTAVNLIGGYCEKAMTYSRSGGVINKIGSYEHFNSLNFASDATVNMIGSSAGPESKLVVLPKARAMWQTMIRGTFTPLDIPDGITVRSTLNSVDGYAMRSQPIPVKGNVKNKNVRRIKISFSYKFKSGFTANTDLFMHPGAILYSKTAGRTNTIGLSQFPLGMLKNTADGNTHSFEYYFAPVMGSAANTLDENGFFDYIMLNFSFFNGATNVYPNFSTDNLDIDIYNLTISIYTDDANSFVYDLRSGPTANRPPLNTTDRGYRYYDTTVDRVLIWSGTAWANEINSNDLIAGSATSPSLASAANSINTSGKYRGRLVLNATNNKFYIAIGSATVDNWVAVDDSTVVITPV